MSSPSSKVFEQREEENKSHIYFLLCEDEDGEEGYCYLEVKGREVEDFENAQESEAFVDFENFGKIIEEGSGLPSKEVQQRIEEEYGFSHDEIREELGLDTL